MTASTKVLLIVFAIAALVTGVVVNSARNADRIDTNTLLSAKLMIIDNSPSSTAFSDGSNTTIERHLGELSLVNFWASWCAPCRKEMPVFEAMYRQTSIAPGNSRGFRIIGIAIDSPDKAQPMLDSMDITYPILYAPQTGMQLMESVGNPQGLLPYSLLLDKQGRVLEQVLGPIHEQDIVNWLHQYL